MSFCRRSDAEPQVGVRIRRSDDLGELGEGLGAVGGDDQGVLDANATDAGEVDAGLDGHDLTRRQGTRGRLRHPWGLVDLEPDAVTGAVREHLAPAGGVDHVAARAVDRGALDARGHRRPARPAGSPPRRPRRGAPRGRDRRRSPCGSCRSSTRRRCSRSRSRRARRARWAGRWGARAAWRRWVPTPRSGRSSCRSRPLGASRTRAASANSRSVGPSARDGSSSPSASSAIPQAARIRATSPGSLTRRSASTSPSVGTSSGAANHCEYVRCWAHVTPWASSPRRRGRRSRARERVALCARGRADDDLGVDAGGVELLARLLGVATVGDEGRAVGPDEHQRRRSGEARQVPDVREAGDEQRVDAGGRRIGPAGGPCARPTSIAGRARSVGAHDPSSVSTTASTARR